MRMQIGLLTMVLAAGNARCGAQTIQLPSFSTFSVDTTVLVPDSGPAPLARDRTLRSGRNSFGGLPRQWATGVERRAVGAGVVARIHDPVEAEQAIADEARVRHGAEGRQGAQPESGLARAAQDPALASVAEIETARAQKAAAQQRAAFAILEKARQAKAAGKTAVAKIHYRSAARQAIGTLRQEIDAELRALDLAGASSKDRTAVAPSRASGS